MSTGAPPASAASSSLLLPNIQPRLEKNDRISVWRLPSDISQSRLGGRTSPSNACTLIALQLIELFERRSLHFLTPTHTRLPPPPLPRVVRATAGAETRMNTVCTRYLLGTFIEAMVDGNEAHERATKTRKAEEQNFTIPDAISALQKKFTEIDFCSVSGSFVLQLPKFIRIAMRSPSLCALPRLHFIIIAFERTVLLVSDRKTNSLILLDSHLHGSVCGPTTGAILASAHFSDLTPLVQWMSEHIFPETHFASCVQEFEISTVIYTGERGEEGCSDASTSSSSMGGFRISPRPYAPLQPMPIFTPTMAGKENVQPKPQQLLQMHQPPSTTPTTGLPPIPKKVIKRAADLPAPSQLVSKRVCSAEKDAFSTE